MRNRIRVIFIAVALAALPRGAGAEAKMMTWTIDGMKREAIVFLPRAKSAGGKAPLVLSFHGHGDDIENFQQVDLQGAWPEAIVVYFQGLPTARADETPLPGWQVQAGAYGDRDLKLVDAAVAALRQQYSVNEARIYATGFSNGANFTYLLWQERPNLFAAYAPVAAALRPPTMPKTPKPIFHIAGTQDQTIKFENQLETMETARKINGAERNGVPCGTGCTIYKSSTGPPVVTWIHPGGHEYPDGTSQRIVKFFKQYSLDERRK